MTDELVRIRALGICEISNILVQPSLALMPPGHSPENRSVQDSLRVFKAGIFQALAHPTRIAIVELLRDEEEVAVSAVYERLGLEQSNVSQHLAVLRSKHLVQTRKEGNQVFYSLCDKIIGDVLDLMRLYFHSHLAESLELLKDMAPLVPVPEARTAAHN